MAEAQAAKKETGKAEGQAAVAAKPKAPVQVVTMTDGRKVEFAGKRQMLKEVLIDEATNSVSVRFDFRNSETRTFTPPTSLFLDFVGHGVSQKVGDETAGETDVDDMVIAVDDIIARLSQGVWGATRAAGDGFSGASVVIRAIVEATGKTVEYVKDFLQKKLDTDKAAGGKLTRAALYASFRNPTSKTGQIIERLEREKKSKASAVDADALLGELK